MEKLHHLEEKHGVNNKNRAKELRKDFVKKYKLPIPVLTNENGEFGYFLLLYASEFNTIEKYDKYLEVAGHPQYFQESSEFMDKVKTAVRDNGVVDALNEMDLDNKELRELQKGLNIVGSNILDPDNHNKKYISLDIKQADYNTLKKVKPEFFNKDTFEEWVLQFDETNKYEHLNLRRVIFGHLNAKRQQKIQKQGTVKLMHNITKEYDVEFITLGNDEVVMEYDSDLNEGLTKIVKESESELEYTFRKEVFTLKYMGKYELGYIKEFDNKKPEFTGVNKNFFAQSYKKYYNLPITESDLVFELGGIPSQFLKPIV